MSAWKGRKARRLLPLNAYPDDIDEAGRDRVDKRLRSQLPLIPREPGTYLDREGVAWTLDSAGCWTDSKGVTRAPEYTPLVSMFGPWRDADKS